MKFRAFLGKISCPKFSKSSSAFWMNFRTFYEISENLAALTEKYLFFVYNDFSVLALVFPGLLGKFRHKHQGTQTVKKALFLRNFDIHVLLQFLFSAVSLGSFQDCIVLSNSHKVYEIRRLYASKAYLNGTLIIPLVF